MLVFDLESDGLLDELTVIHCIHVTDRTTGQRLRFNDGVYADGSPARRDGSIDDGCRLIQDAEEIGGHSIVGFDIKAIHKTRPWFKPRGKIRDSLAESRLIWTTMFDVDEKARKAGKRPPEFMSSGYMGTHKLGAWGFRLGIHKGEFKGPWDAFTQEMDDYGAQDVEVNVALFDWIDGKAYSPAALDTENVVHQLVDLQEQHGFVFDVPAAESLLHELTVRRAALDDELRVAFKPWWEPVRVKGRHDVLTPRVKNGKMGYTPDCPLTKVVMQTFNPSSRAQIANRLKVLFNWTPVEFTPKGEPKIDETTLTGMDYPEAKLLHQYLMVDKRISQLAEGKQAWLKAVKPDGRIHGRINPMGTVSHRGAHSNPNLGQVPNADSEYGHECRALFTVPKGRELVGIDGEGIQLRVLGHLMYRFDGGAFSEAVAYGDKKIGTDAHTLNKNAIGLNTRDAAKTFIYAYLLGAGAWKLGSIVYEDFTEARRSAFNAKYPPGEVRDKAFERLGNKAKRDIEGGLPALKAAQGLIKEKAKRGYILGLDGRRLTIRSLHTALSSYLQGGEAVIMKLAMKLMHEAYAAEGWQWFKDYGQVAWVHDEYQLEVYDPANSERFGQIAADCITQAGVILGLHCHFAGEWKRGPNWDATH
jgi:DNA polymerase-1